MSLVPNSCPGICFRWHEFFFGEYTMKASRNLVQGLQTRTITSPDDLLITGLIPPDHLAAVSEASATLPISITLAYWWIN